MTYDGYYPRWATHIVLILMSILRSIRDNASLRRPVLALTGWLLKPLRGGPGFWARAYYDSIPRSLLIAGNREVFVVATNDRVIGRELFLRNEFDFSKLEATFRLIEREGLPRPRRLVDVGANVGSIAIPALCRGFVESAVAIEPHPANARLLRANVALNGVDERIDVIELAVGSETDALLHLEESHVNSGNHRVAAEGIPIRCTRLDDLGLPSEGTLLWMDIEGYEGHALSGAPALLALGVPVVAEFNPFFLEQSRGRSAFDEALQRRRIFDLAAPEQPTTLDDLYKKYVDSYTDIVAL
jgi:FkbM family methyltransferase